MRTRGSLQSPKKVRSREGLGIWNVDIKNTIKVKQQAYKISLQGNIEEARSIYKGKRNYVKEIVRKAHQELGYI